MKIICVGRNYAEHAKELKNEVPDKPVIFLKPDSALNKDQKAFFLPDWSNDIHYEAELVFKIGKTGKYIREEFADKYLDSITVGIDFTARDLQSELKSKGLPWEIAKGFDGSAVIGSFFPINEISKRDSITFSLTRNNETVQQGNSADMIFSPASLIAYVSRFFTLKTGDLIFTGTPKGVGKVFHGDRLKGFLEGSEVFDIRVR